MAKEKEEDQKTSLVSTQLIQSLPEADKAQALEKLFPGATSRFFELIAEEGNHRKAVEVKTIENEEKKSKRYHNRRVIAMSFGLFIGFIALGLSTLIILKTDQWSAQLSGSLLGAGGVLGLIKVYLDYEK